MWTEDRWINWAAIAGMIIISVGFNIMVGASMEENTILKDCVSKGEIEIQSGALKVHIKCSVDGVGV